MSVKPMLSTRNNMQQDVQKDATCNIQQLLGVFGQQCCVRLHGASRKQYWELLRPLARSLKVNIIHQ